MIPEQTISLHLTTEEEQALIWIIDVAIRSAGIKSKPAVDLVWPKIEAAKAMQLDGVTTPSSPPDDAAGNSVKLATIA